MDSDQLTLAMFARRARREFGDRTVVSVIDDTVITLTYAELFARVDRLAAALYDQGVRPGHRIGTLAWNHHRHLELYLAVTLSGAVLHTVNLRLSVQQAKDVVAHAGDAIVFADDDLTDHIAALAAAGHPVISMGAAKPDAAIADYEELLSRYVDGGSFVYPQLDERAAAAMSYSSATTGRPKGVVYSHRALVTHSMMLCMRDTWAIGEADTVLPVVPMFHVNAWGLPFAALWMGSKLVLAGRRPTAARILDLLRTQAVTFAAAVPTIWLDIVASLDKGDDRLPAMRAAISGGAPMPRTLLREADRVGLPIVHSYGMTEASPVVLVSNVRSDTPTGDEREQARLRQGNVVPGLDFKILDSSGVAVPWDGRSTGELWLRGPWVAEEYEQDERTTESFVDGWYKTGDIVSIDSRGRIQVADRASDMIKSGGEWISSVEVEGCLMDHPAVALAAVVAMPDSRWQERPRAFIVSSDTVSASELKDFAAARLPRFWVPDEFVFVDEIPLTSVGKFDKKQLRKMLD